MATPATVASFDAYRYRDALKDLSRILSQHMDEGELLAEFLRLVRELLGVGKLAIFMRQLPDDLFARPNDFRGARNWPPFAARVLHSISLNTCG